MDKKEKGVQRYFTQKNCLSPNGQATLQTQKLLAKKH